MKNWFVIFSILSSLFLLGCDKTYHSVKEYKGFRLGQGVSLSIDECTRDYGHAGFKTPPEFQFAILAIQPFPDLEPDEIFNPCLDNEECMLYARKMAKFGGWVEVPPEFVMRTTTDDETYQKNIRAIIILNKEHNIIGIYPNKTMKNIDDIMKNYPQYSKPLPEFKNFRFMQDLWKMEDDLENNSLKGLHAHGH